MKSIKLDSYLKHPAARQARREYSVMQAFEELKREKELFADVVSQDNKRGDRAPERGRLETREAGTSRRAEWVGDFDRGAMIREEALFLSSDPESPPSFHTTTKTHFHPFGMEKVVAIAGADGVHVRRQLVDVSEATYCYSEEFFIAH